MTGLLPNQTPSDFGHLFNYEVWTPNTQVTMASVPWDATYRDIVRFDSSADLDAYLLGQQGVSVTIRNMTYAKPGHPVRIDAGFNWAFQYNYLRVHNPSQPSVPGDFPKTMYYFITDVKYVAPNTTELQVQLDVWQTFQHNIQFGRAYIERGHLGIANEDQFHNNGSSFLTVPEGLDLGGEYGVFDQWAHYMCSPATGVEPQVIVTTNVSLIGSWGTMAAPKLTTASGSRFEGLPNGCEIYIFTMSDFVAFMKGAADYPWITQGIISVTAIPPVFDMDHPAQTYTINGGQLPGVTITRLDKGKMIKEQRVIVEDLFGSYGFQLDSRYRFLHKFRTYPYSFLELTTNSGAPIILKPENLWDSKVTVNIEYHVIPPNPRIVVYPHKYNSFTYKRMVNQNGDTLYDFGEQYDLTTGWFNLPMFSVVNNGYLSYMASNANSIAYGYASADWSQQRALAGNELGYSQASVNMGTAATMNNLSVGAANASTALGNQSTAMRTGVNVVGGLAGGSARGGMAGLGMGALGAASSVAGAAIDINQSTQQNAINTGLMNARTGATLANMGYMRDTNKDYADFAARGDYQNAVAGLNAKVQDAKMIQPTTSGQVGGDAFMLAANGWAVHVKLKRIMPAVAAMIGDYWLRYGYAINRYFDMNDGLNCMTKFTYWKTKETYLRIAYCPESFRQTIRGIFEKGVTVWEHPDYIGNVDPGDNEPYAGIRIPKPMSLR